MGDSIIKSRRQFWQDCAYSAFRGAEGKLTISSLISTGILGVVSFNNPQWSNWLNLLVWVIPIGVFLGVFFWHVYREPHRVYMAEAEKVKEYETEQFELVVEDNDQYVRFEDRRNIWVCRVGIRAKGQRTIRGVQVYLKSYNGNDNAFGDAPLCPADRLRNVTGALTINPDGVLKFVEFWHWYPQKPGMAIPYNINYQLEQSGVNPQTSPYSLPTAVPEGNYDVTLLATGENSKAVEKCLSIEIQGDKLHVYEKRQA